MIRACIYEEEIMGVELQCKDKYYITGLTNTPPVVPSPPLVEIYFDGSLINIQGTCVFESNAEYPGDRDWGGIWKQGSVFVINEGNIEINNTDLGDI